MRSNQRRCSKIYILLSTVAESYFQFYHLIYAENINSNFLYHDEYFINMFSQMIEHRSILEFPLYKLCV